MGYFFPWSAIGVASLLLSYSQEGLSSQLEVYLESWDPSWQSALENLPPAPGQTSENSYKNVTLNISFGAYAFPGLNGVQFSEGDVQEIVDFVHAHGGKVKLSYGGNSHAVPWYPLYFISMTPGWPSNVSALAAGVVSVVNDYDLDGVDFDIEDAQPLDVSPQMFADQILSFLQMVRTGLGADKWITLTIPGQGWGTYWELLAKGASSTSGLIDAINFMEYDIWINSSLPQGYTQQIAADIVTYTTSPGSRPSPNGAQGWGIPKHLVQLGLMPGQDDTDPPNVLTLEAASILAQIVVNQDLQGVMLWDLNRDAGTDPIPPTQEGPYAYSDTIRTLLAFAKKTPRTTQHREGSKRHSSSQAIFVRQPPPPHGNP